MSSVENDPDTLQLIDQLDSKWVKLWCNARAFNQEKVTDPQSLKLFNKIIPNKKQGR